VEEYGLRSVVSEDSVKKITAICRSSGLPSFLKNPEKGANLV
jgi:hypothetical protein